MAEFAPFEFEDGYALAVTALQLLVRVHVHDVHRENRGVRPSCENRLQFRHQFVAQVTIAARINDECGANRLHGLGSPAIYPTHP